MVTTITDRVDQARSPDTRSTWGLATQPVTHQLGCVRHDHSQLVVAHRVHHRIDHDSQHDLSDSNTQKTACRQKRPIVRSRRLQTHTCGTSTWLEPTGLVKHHDRRQACVATQRYRRPVTNESINENCTYHQCI